MLNDIISTAIGVVVTGSVGYLIGIVKNYKKMVDNYKNEIKDNKEALKCLLRSNITSKYYVYKEMGKMPYYEKENIDYMFEQYKKMGGNSYVDGLVRELNQLPNRK